METSIQPLREALRNAQRVVVLTGAGVSAESGIPTFRGAEGLWKTYQAKDLATPEAFVRDPELVWEFYNWRRALIGQKTCNPAHTALAQLENIISEFTLITQNVDGLHQMAGNRDVIEFHGNFAWLQCLDCGQRVKTVDVNLDHMPPRCPCGGIYRPECVFFGEMIPPEELDRSQIAASSCDLMLVVGCSAVVQPAAYMASAAKRDSSSENPPFMKSDELSLRPTGNFLPTAFRMAR